MIKRIYSLSVSNVRSTTTDTILGGGASRAIIITGDAGAMFNLTIKNSSDCSILESPLENVLIPGNGVYNLTQIFPQYENNNVTRLTSKEVYDIEVLPGIATTTNIGAVLTHSITQYPDPTVTITSTTSSSGTGSWTIVGSDATLKGRALTSADSLTPGFAIGASSTRVTSYGEVNYTIAINEYPTDWAGFLYVSKLPDLYNNFTVSTDVNRVVSIKNKNDSEMIIQPSSPAVPAITTGDDIKVGMVFRGKATEDKLLESSIGVDDCYTSSDKLRLHDTKNLEIGMGVSGTGIVGGVILVSIDNDTDITISSKQEIKNHTMLTFTSPVSGVVTSIQDVNTITTDFLKKIKYGTELKFYNPGNENTTVTASIRTSGSGSNTITVTGKYNIKNFGKEDVTYTQLVDEFITTTPNAYTQYIDVAKNTATTINVLLEDRDLNTKTPTSTAQDDPSHGTLNKTAWSAGVGTTIYTPNTGYTGTDKFYFYANDGTNLSARTPIYITVK